jgi:LysR family transcriptional regulator, regulator for bpeEF and oprC
MPRIDPLHVFIAVVDHKSFTRAASALGFTPSAVSKQISQLEERLGARLLHRTTRSVMATEAGQLYYDRCRQILEALDDTETQIRALENVPQGRIRVLAQPFFGRAALARIFRGFQLRYPEVFIDLTLSEGLPAVSRDAFDVSLLLERAEVERLVSRELVQLPTILCASHAYLELTGRPQHEADLAKRAFIEITAPSHIETPHWSSVRSFVVNDVDMAYHAVREGMGIGLLPFYVARRDLERGRLEQLLPDLSLSSQSVWVSYPALRHQSPKTRAFVDFLTNTLAPPRAEPSLT